MEARDASIAVRRELGRGPLSLACLSIKADVPAAQARAIVQRLKREGLVTEKTGTCQLCGATTALVYAAATCEVV